MLTDFVCYFDSFKYLESKPQIGIFMLTLSCLLLFVFGGGAVCVCTCEVERNVGSYNQVKLKLVLCFPLVT